MIENKESQSRDTSSENISDPLKKIGQKLKSSRESQNISSAKLAETLRIGEEQLRAIENGEHKLLPEKVFYKRNGSKNI